MRKPFLFSACLLIASHASAAIEGLRPEAIYVGDLKKTGSYIREGVIQGGDKSVDQVVIKGIRRGGTTEFDRIVLDLQGNPSGEATNLKRAPFHMVEVSPEMNRLVITVFGNPKLDFNSALAQQDLRKSSLIEKVDLLPLVVKDRWTFALQLRKKAAVEVFELAGPARIIIDLKKK